MQRPKLTNSAVERFPSTEADRAKPQAYLWCGEVKGFGVRWSKATNVRAYFVQYRVKGSKQERQVTIGRHNDPFRVDQARAEAIRIKAQMVTGVDPVLEAQRAEEQRQLNAKLTAGQAATLQEMLNDYLANHRTRHSQPLREATKADMRRDIEGNLKDWLDKPITTITRDRCVIRFGEVTKRGPTTANLTFVYLRAVLNHAREKFADEDGNFTVMATNPVTRMLKKEHLNKETPRTRRIRLTDVGKAWFALAQLRARAKRTQDRTSVDLVCLRLLTGIRKRESGALLWSQIDLENKVIQLSPEVNKTHQAMGLPMSMVLHELLAERAQLPRTGDRAQYVFPAPKANSKTPYMSLPVATMETVCKAIGYTVSSHDFRRTLVDVAKACKVDPSEREQLLGHAASGVHRAHYDNDADSTALRAAVESVAQYIIEAGRVAEAQASGANVISFPGKSA